MTQPKIRAVLVRRAVVDDADAIERVRTDTWRDAYRGLMPDSLLNGLGDTRIRIDYVTRDGRETFWFTKYEGALHSACTRA